MKSSVYEYQDYKSYLIDAIESATNEGRGQRKKLAATIGCQISHVSNVLGGPGHFSQEQAEAAARHLGLGYDETDYFLSLVQFARAGSIQLKKFYEKALAAKSARHNNLKNRLELQDSLKSEQEARYYSSWHYGAVHVLLSIPKFQTREAIADRLDLPLERVDEILLFLVDAGLCRKVAHKFEITRAQVHLESGSHLISKHHTNWRMRAVASLDKVVETDMHFSSVFTLARKDIPRVREALTLALADCVKTIAKSPEEEIAAINIDYFVI